PLSVCRLVLHCWSLFITPLCIIFCLYFVQSVLRSFKCCLEIDFLHVVRYLQLRLYFVHWHIVSLGEFSNFEMEEFHLLLVCCSFVRLLIAVLALILVCICIFGIVYEV